jgi:hypothetical protein
VGHVLLMPAAAAARPLQLLLQQHLLHCLLLQVAVIGA